MSDFFPIDWEAFHFLRPKFLWLLLPLVLVAILGVFGKTRRSAWEKHIAPHLRPFVINKGTEGVAVRIRLLYVIALGIAVLGLSGPSWRQEEQEEEKVESAMYVLVELSESMLIRDLQPNRLERAKFKIEELLDSRPGARSALIGYAGSAHSVVPLTDDYRIVKDHLKAIAPGIMPLPGNDLKGGLDLLDSLSSGNDAPATVVVFFDDVAPEDKDVLLAYANITPHRLELVPMNMNPEAVDAVSDASVLDMDLMEHLEANDRVWVNYLTLDNSDMEDLAKRVKDNLEFTKAKEGADQKWLDMGWYFIIPVALTLLLWFRKGWVIYILPLVFMTSCSGDHRFSDLWFSRDYQGQRLSDKADYRSAAERYDDPVRAGVAWYKAGDYEAARKAFARDSSAYGLYNLGLTLLKTGDTLEAGRAFEAALEMDPEMEAAKKNEEVIKGWSEASVEDAEKSTPEEGEDNNIENKDMEDLGGGGQEATEEDMEQERKEETVETDVRMGQETNLPPDDTEGDIEPASGKIMMRKVNEDPATFLRQKFEYQVRNRAKNKSRNKQ